MIHCVVDGRVCSGSKRDEGLTASSNCTGLLVLETHLTPVPNIQRLAVWHMGGGVFLTVGHENIPDHMDG